MDLKYKLVLRCPVSGDEGKIRHKECVDQFFDTPGKWTYMKNLRTGHTWIRELPNSEDQISKLYENYYTHKTETKSKFLRELDAASAFDLGYSSANHKSWFLAILRLLPSLTAASKLEWLNVPMDSFNSVLDFGCGSGALLKKYDIGTKTVVGYEPDPRAANVAKKDGLVVFTYLDEISKRYDKFDLIIMSHVIEHLSNPQLEIKKLIPLLSANGRIIITTPNANSLGHLIFGKYWRGLEPPRHFNIFTFSSMQEMAQNLNLEVTLCSTSRLARSIFFQSMLARMGYANTEMKKPKNRVLNVLGYVFQVVEHLYIKLRKQSGEELYVELRSK